MGLSVVPMNVIDLAGFLTEYSTEYVTIQEAITAGNLALQTGGAGLAGTGIHVVGGAGASVVDGAVTASNIVDFAAAQQLAATGAEVSTSAIGAVQTASGGAKLTGVLGVELGTVAAAVAPLMGVALGVDLYRQNPDFWTKLSQKLLPFCWPDTTKIPSWAELFENTWVTTIPKKVYDAIKELFDEEGIGKGDTEVVTNNTGFFDDIISEIPLLNRVTAKDGTTYEPVGSAKMAWWTPQVSITPDNNVFGIVVADDNTSIAYTIDFGRGPKQYPARKNFSNDGRIVYYDTLSLWNYDIMSPSFEDLPFLPRLGTPINTFYDHLAWVIKYGNISSSANYPTGTSQWTGTTVPEIHPGKPAYIDPNTTEETIPVAFPPEVVPQPSYKPGVQPEPLEIPNSPSADPEEFPDPDKVKDPDVQVEPHIMPSPVPWETPVPTPNPSPYPDTDPDIQPQPQPQPSPLPYDWVPYPDGIVPFPKLPDTPLPFAQNVGLVTVYHPTASQLYSFEQWLWVTYQDAEIQKIWNNPFDGVISLFELYCTPTDIGTRNIHSGFLDSGVNSAIISRYTEINCGTLTVPEYYGNYLDYSPYTRAYIYLPFIGVQELNSDDIVGHAVNVTYRIDEYNGSCIAMITVAKTTMVNGERKDYSNIMYQFSGNCSVELPFSGGSQAQIKAGFMMANAYQTAASVSALGQAIGGLASMISTNPMGALGGAISGITSTVANAGVQSMSSVLSGKSVVAHSGSFGASHGAMGVKNPFITIVRPKQVRVPNYNELYGYPAHKQVLVGACTGFLRCLEVHVVSATATDEEKSTIEYMMKTGVYVTE